MTTHAVISRALVLALLMAACAQDPAQNQDGAAPNDFGASAQDARTNVSDGAIVDGGIVADGGVADAGPPQTVVRVHYPTGTRSLSIRGDGAGLNWQTGALMNAGVDDTWSYVLPNAPARTEYKPLLDDAQWSRGANYVIHAGETVDIYPHFIVAHGAVSMFDASFHSTALGNNRIVWMYLPPSYTENTRARFPVLYMQDGQNLFDPARAFGGNEWKVDETLDASAEGDGAIAEMIVIAPEASAGRLYEYSPSVDDQYMTGGGADAYLSLLFDELKPLVDAQLRTLPDRAHTGVLGSSMGGLLSAYAGIARPQNVGMVGAMSPSTWWDDLTIVSRVTAAGMPTPRPDRVYVDSGSPSDGYAETQMLVAAYHGVGYVDGVSFLSVVQNGAMHSEVYWAMRLPGALAFLFGPR